jgi:predicted HTH domain antitoxin
MTLEIPIEATKARTPEWAALHLAIGLYVSAEMSLGKAAEIASLTRDEFLEELRKRKISLNYSTDDLRADLKAVREISAKLEKFPPGSLAHLFTEERNAEESALVGTNPSKC